MIIDQDPKQKQLKKFSKLSEEWRINQNGKDADALKAEICQVAMCIVQQEMAKKFDPELLELKEKLKTANEPYSEGKKTNNLKISYNLALLEDKGEAVPSIDDFLSAAAKRAGLGQREEQEDSE